MASHMSKFLWFITRDVSHWRGSTRSRSNRLLVLHSLAFVSMNQWNTPSSAGLDIWRLMETWYVQRIKLFIISILKSLVIPAIWLDLSSVIYSQFTLFSPLNHIFYKWRHSCSKSHHFYSISHHFCFKCKMRCNSLFLINNDVKDVKSFFVSAFQQTGYLVNKILVMTEYGCNKVVIELRVMQFWSQIRRLISNRTRTTRSSEFEITRMISDQMHSIDLSTQFNYHCRSDKRRPFVWAIWRKYLHAIEIS